MYQSKSLNEISLNPIVLLVSRDRHVKVLSDLKILSRPSEKINLIGPKQKALESF
jgi:hypothetical protein